MIKTYEELIQIPEYIDRYRYLKLDGSVGYETFGFRRYLNQLLYSSHRWKRLRNDIIIRDNGCDLAFDSRDIIDLAVVHHIVPITEDDILNDNPMVFDPSNLITCSSKTHKAIHYGDESLLPKKFKERSPGDTILWKKR